MEGKVAVITGDASGIGRATPLRFATRGCVVGIDVDKDRLAETGNLIKEFGGQFHAEHFDLARVEDIPSLMERVLSETGRVDILVNNAFTFDADYLMGSVIVAAVSIFLIGAFGLC